VDTSSSLLRDYELCFRDSSKVDINDVREIGPWSNKLKQMQKQNTEDTQYKRDTDLRGSPSVGYVHQRNCQVLYYYPENEGIQPTTKPAVTSSSFFHSLLSQNTIFTIIHSRNTFPS
jgi:hypothetical protein